METAILSVVGIALGWFLKELSDSWRASGERRRRLGRAVAALAYVNNEMIMLRGMFEAFKEFSDNIPEYERYRQYVLKRYPRQDAKFKDELAQAVTTIAEELPLQSLQLSHVIERYYFLQSSKLSESSKIPELYGYQLASIEVGFDLYQKLLQSMLTRLAFRHGFVTGLQTMRETRRLGRNARKGQEGVTKLALHMKGLMAKEKSEKKNEEQPVKAASSEGGRPDRTDAPSG